MKQEYHGVRLQSQLAMSSQQGARNSLKKILHALYANKSCTGFELVLASLALLMRDAYFSLE